MKRPVSDRKRAANRQNSLHSTGPTRKSASRYNAYRHGFFAHEALAMGPPALENPFELLFLSKSIRENLSPMGELQGAVADDICITIQNIKRLMRYEAGVMRDRVRHALLEQARDTRDGDTAAVQWTSTNSELKRIVAFVDWLKTREPDLFQDEEFLERVYLRTHKTLENRPEDWRVETRAFLASLTETETASLTESLRADETVRYMEVFEKQLALSPPPVALLRALIPNEAEMDRIVRYTNHYARHLERKLALLALLQHWDPKGGGEGTQTKESDHAD